MHLEVKEIRAEDAKGIVDYFLNAHTNFLFKIGVDPNSLPNKEDWINTIIKDSEVPDSDKKNFYLIWYLNDSAIGHSNINNIEFGKTAYMHLHLWDIDKRQSGLGFSFLQLAINIYFDRFKLQYIICEPNAKNIASNKILNKLGFRRIKTYDTKPSLIAQYQTVNQYKLLKSEFIYLII